MLQYLVQKESYRFGAICIKMTMTLFTRPGKNPKIHIEAQKVPSSQNNHKEKEILAATQYRIIRYIVEGSKSPKHQKLWKEDLG